MPLRHGARAAGAEVAWLQAAAAPYYAGVKGESGRLDGDLRLQRLGRGRGGLRQDGWLAGRGGEGAGRLARGLGLASGRQRLGWLCRRWDGRVQHGGGCGAKKRREREPGWGEGPELSARHPPPPAPSRRELSRRAVHPVLRRLPLMGGAEPCATAGPVLPSGCWL